MRGRFPIQTLGNDNKVALRTPFKIKRKIPELAGVRLALSGSSTLVVGCLLNKAFPCFITTDGWKTLKQVQGFALSYNG